MARRTGSIKTKPIALSLHPDRGYTLSAEVVDGPQSMIGRVVTVMFNSLQLNEIAAWEPTQAIARLDLNVNAGCEAACE